MPVRRFRSAEEMNQPRWREPGDPALVRAIASVWGFGQRTVARHFPPGIYRHRSIESLNEQTDAWAASDFEAFRRARPQPGGNTGSA
jgi:hypothetical protein